MSLPKAMVQILSLSTLLCLCSSIAPYSKRPWKVIEYLTSYRYLANQLHEQRGIPLAIIFAVAGLESDWGQSELAKNSNNHFGIKDDDWRGPVYCKFTMEWQSDNGYLPVRDCFRKYSLIAGSYQDFGSFLQSRPNYQYLFDNPRWDYTSWAWHLQAGGYATDPEYASKIIRVIENYELYSLDHE